MKVGIDYKNIWDISYPIILGGLANTLLNLTDTAFVGRLGETELASMALTTIYYYVVVMIAISIGTGIQILMSRRAGEGDRNEIGKIFDHGFLILSISGLAFTLIMHFTAHDLFASILKSSDVVEASMQYMSARSYGVFFAFTTVALRSFFIAIGQTKIITTAAVLMLVLNGFLDYVLIFGKLGAPEMGIRGAAMASVISEAVAMFFLIAYCIRNHGFKEFKLFRFESINPNHISHVCRPATSIRVHKTRWKCFHLTLVNGWCEAADVAFSHLCCFIIKLDETSSKSVEVGYLEKTDPVAWES